MDRRRECSFHIWRAVAPANAEMFAFSSNGSCPVASDLQACASRTGAVCRLCAGKQQSIAQHHDECVRDQNTRRPLSKLSPLTILLLRILYEIRWHSSRGLRLA